MQIVPIYLYIHIFFLISLFFLFNAWDKLKQNIAQVWSRMCKNGQQKYVIFYLDFKVCVCSVLLTRLHKLTWFLLHLVALLCHIHKKREICNWKPLGMCKCRVDFFVVFSVNPRICQFESFDTLVQSRAVVRFTAIHFSSVQFSSIQCRVARFSWVQCSALA